MTNLVEDIKREINSADLSFDEIATVFEVTVRQVDLVFLDMINECRHKDEPLFNL